MKLLSASLLCFILIFSGKFEENNSYDLLRSGPMVGYSQMREVALWVQTTKPATVKIRYWIDGKELKDFYTNEVETEKSNAFTAKLLAYSVEPGNTYNYELLINDQVVERPYDLTFQSLQLWEYRTDPPPFSFATGSGAHINEEAYDRPKPYAGDYEIYTSVLNKTPDFMLWLGDNIYLREADYHSWTGIVNRYTYHRSQNFLQPLWGSVHHYAIWDDHDFGPNNSDRSFWNKERTLEAFKLFWPNPSFGVNGNPGTTTFFNWSDCDFFLIDNRYNRSPNNRKLGKKEILGEEQVEWLIDALTFSYAPFKFIAIGGQFLSPVANYENHANYNDEREAILKKINDEEINGVIFLTGDRHFTELSKMDRQGTYPLYDFTISPFTSGANTHELEPNNYRVEGTHVTKRNFAIFNFDGPRNDRNMKCSVYDKDGLELWNYSINENELK